MAEQRQAEKSIFLAAVSIASDAERAAFIERECAGDPRLRAEVEALLQAHARPQPLLDGGPTIDRPASEAAGTVVGPYKLLEPIGEGGMGTVWMAQQTDPIKRLVAVKLIKAGMDSRQVLARFEAERQALALMDHAHIARVLDAGTTPEGRPYFVMDLVRGVPITRYCDEHRLTPRQRLELFIPVCQAIQHAHQKGVIHRDIKPSNVLVALYDGRPVPKVIDFGVAKAAGQTLTDKTLVTGFGALVGTLEYMSPEQAEVNQLDIDTRSDIYSLGVLLYELLTGSPPFTKKDLEKAGLLEMLRVIREREPPVPSTRLSTAEGLPTLAANRGTEPAKLTKLVRGDLDWIVMKALAKDRNRRYETANGFAADVQRYLADEPVLACPPSAAYRLRKFVLRNTMAFSASILIAAVLILGTTTSTWLALRAYRAEGLAEERLDTEHNALKQAAHERDLAQRRQYDARLAEAQASRWSGRAGRRFGGLKALREAAQLARDLHLGPEEILKLRNEAIACMALADLRLDAKWPGYPPGSVTTGIAFDPDMERFARVDENGHITVRRLADNRELVRIPDCGAPAPQRAPDWRMFLTFSPDGHLLAAAGDSQHSVPLQVWDLRGPKRLLQADAAGGFDCPLDFSPDGRVLVARGIEGTSVSLYDVATARRQRRLPLGQSILSVRFHPQGDRLAMCDGSRVLMVDLFGRPLGAPLAHPGDVYRAAWSNDGQLLAAPCADGQVYIWAAAHGKLQAICKGHQGLVLQAAFNHRGDLLATTAEDETTRLWEVHSGKELLSTNGLAAHFGGGDRWLGFGVFGHDVGRWEAALAGESRSLHGHSRDAAVIGLSVSSDGRWLASAAADGVRLWDVDAATPIGFLPTGETYSVIFDHFSRFLITASDSGLYRWPIRPATNLPSRRAVFGPPEPIPVSPRSLPQWASLSKDGGTLVVRARSWNWNVIIDLNRPADPPRLLTPANYPAVSPDAQWVATAVADAYEGKLWNAQTGTWLRDFPGIRSANVAFSPDNRWLVFATAAAFRFYHVGSWKPGPHVARDYGGYFPGPVAFTGDGKVAAIGYTTRDIRLIACESGSEIASFAPPVPEELTSLCFTHDGGRLAAGTRHGMVRLWDLRRIREQLREMGLDWEPPLQPGPIVADAQPVTIDVDRGHVLDREKYSLILAYFPLHAEMYYRRGLTYTRFGQWQEAVSDFGMTLRLRPDHPAAYQARAEAYAALRQWDKAASDYSNALQRKGDDWEVWHARAQTYAHSNEWQRAVADYTRAIELKPGHAEAWMERSAAYVKLGRWDMVLADVSKAIELNPDLAPAWHRRAHAHAHLRQWEQALADFSKSIELQPKNHEYRNCRGLAYARLNQWGKAISDFSEAITLARNVAAYWSHRSNAYHSTHRWREAVADCSEAIKLAPEDPVLWSNRGNTHAELGQWQDALADFVKAVELKNAGIAIWYRLALVRLHLGDREGYRAACERMRAQFSEAKDLQLVDLAIWTSVLSPDATRDLPRLVRLGETVAAGDPRTSENQITLGAALYRAGRYPEAVRRLTEAEADFPHARQARHAVAYAWLFLAMAHHRLGHAAEAQRWLNQAVQDIDHPSAERLKEPGAGTWNRRLTLQLLRREAEELLKGRRRAASSSWTNSALSIARRCRRRAAFSFALGTPVNGLGVTRFDATHRLPKDTTALR